MKHQFDAYFCAFQSFRRCVIFKTHNVHPRGKLGWPVTPAELIYNVQILVVHTDLVSTASYKLLFQ